VSYIRLYAVCFKQLGHGVVTDNQGAVWNLVPDMEGRHKPMEFESRAPKRKEVTGENFIFRSPLISSL
jgi:hypothetical protein